MGLIEVEHRQVNSHFVIMTERGDGTPATDMPAGRVRVTVLPGRTFEIDGPAAEKFLVDLKAEMQSERSGAPMQPIFGRPASPPSDSPEVSARKRRVKPR